MRESCRAATATIRALCFFRIRPPLLLPPLLHSPPLSPRRLAPDGPPAVEDPRHAVGDRILLGDAEDAARRHRVPFFEESNRKRKASRFGPLSSIISGLVGGLSACRRAQARAEALRWVRENGRAERTENNSRTRRESETEQRKREREWKEINRAGGSKTLHLLFTLFSFLCSLSLPSFRVSSVAFSLLLSIHISYFVQEA